MLASCWLGRCWRETPRETRFRRGWGWIVLAYQTWYTIWYLTPAHFRWNKSLPLEVCDLAAFIAALAMITHWRPWRTILYFWGIGLSTQAFFTPIIQEGLRSQLFWMFWVGHTMIVGSAVYDVVVCRYRPSLRDLRLIAVFSLTYGALAFALDAIFGFNYGFVGNSKPGNPTLIDKLGPWPGRVFILVVIVLADYLLLWAVWPLARRLTGRPGLPPPSSPAPEPTR